MRKISSNFTPLYIIIYCHDGTGHINASLGLAQALQIRGHRVTYLMSELFDGQFRKYGFGEILLKNTLKSHNGHDVQAASSTNPVKLAAEQYIRDGFLSSRSSLEKMKVHSVGQDNYLEVLAKKLAGFNDQIREALARERPDVVIASNFLVPPAILALQDIPWLFHYPLNPLALFHSPKLPPFFSGLPINDPTSWREFRQYQDTEYVGRYDHYQRELNAACGFDDSSNQVKQPDPLGYYAKSKYLNIYAFPEELDYHDVIDDIPDCIVRADEFLRLPPSGSIEPHFLLPEKLSNIRGAKLIYVSLGSMGSVDVELMKRILAVLAKSPHTFIVSKGLRADEYDLPANCWGEAFLPQTQILPLVDLVITHGGNNSVTETFCFGKPMIVLPLFADQYDNAQRVHEQQYGIRVEPYQFTESELLGAIDSLLNDTKLAAKLKIAAERIQNSESKLKVCLKVEEVVRKFKL